MSLEKSALTKFFNIRNVLALLFTGGFFGMVGIYTYFPDVAIPEMIVGAAIAQMTLIVQFFFRRAEPQ